VAPVEECETPAPVAAPVEECHEAVPVQAAVAPAMSGDCGEWAAGNNYAAGATVSCDGSNYTCKQGHTSQADWEPCKTPALWKCN
jgi:hypothetical protein